MRRLLVAGVVAFWSSAALAGDPPPPSALASAGGLTPGNPLASAADLHKNGVTYALVVRQILDGALNDYPSTRFRNVRARLAHSVYSSDEGNFNAVPWGHRGGLVFVICGELNAKNQMGGYTGWRSFVYEPAQADPVTLYRPGGSNANDFKHPAPLPQNLAEKPLFLFGEDDFSVSRVALVCSSSLPDEVTDDADLTPLVAPDGK